MRNNCDNEKRISGIWHNSKTTINGKINKRINGKKSQVFIVGIVILVTFGLISSYMLLSYLYSDKSTDEHLGSYEGAMIDSLIAANKASIYVEAAAKYAAADALLNYSANGGVDIIPTSDEEPAGPKCGKYIYNLWSSQTKDCYPNLKTTFKQYMDDALNKRISIINDYVLSKRIGYDYFFDSSLQGTSILGLASDAYEFPVFKNQEYSQNPEVQKYASTRGQYSGNFIWPLPGYYSISSCFGYREVSYGTTYHAGLDIPAPRGTAVVAAAPGTVSDIKFPNWGRVEINHGGGLKTEYLHMNAIAPGLKIGDQVVQGQKLGEVGGRGANSADDYPNHLHFAVIYDNADLTLNYNGAPAVVDGNWGKYINPICFISNDYLKQNNIQLTFQNSKACTATCDLNGKCSMYPNVQSQAYKFCDLYGNVLPSNKFCQLSSNSDWKISNMNVYPAKVSGDQTVNIQLTIENSGDSCATVYPDIEILDSNNLRVPGSDSWDWQIDKVDVYKKNNIIAFENTAPISCSFDTNAQNAADARKNGRCVLLAPSDNSVMKYKVVAIAKDVKGRVVSTKDFATTIEITKPQSSNVQQNTAASNAQTDSTVTSASQSSLTSAEQKKFDKVKSILESNKLPDGTSYIQYIEKISALDNVPKEIALGVITQESSGSLASVSSAGATGLGNVMPATFNGLKFDNKCTWEQYKSDAACQIRASVSYLKQLYDEINGRTIYYKCAAYCYDAGSTRVCQEAVDFQYTGWEAVLRRYNGAHDYSPKQQTSGCTGSPDFLYVPHVMRWANAWGYTQAATYKTVSKDEIMKGVIGTFYFKPSFDVKIGLDLSVFSNLSDFMNSTAKKCAATSATVGKGQCIDNAIAEFNKDVASKYSGISLTRDCESSSDEKTADSVIESIEDCASSNDVNCQCTLPQTQSGMMIHIEGNSGYTLFSKIAKDNSFNIMSYQTFFNDQDKAQVSQDISLDALKVYKVKDGFKIGSVGNQNSNFCQSTKNEFKMCLKTGYDVSVMDNGKISEKNILLKFAISIRDALAPAPIAGLDLFNKLHSHDSVVVTWTPGKEKDIIRYNIYLGDSANDFSKSTDNYRQKLPYRGFNIPNKEYDIYDNIKFSDEPECSLNYDPNNNPYCKFLYNAIDKDGNNVKIELVDNKLYYLQNIDKFLYILDGNDAYNKLSDKKNKFIAVTAIDSDGNEINNTKDGEKISLNNNLKSILVKDLLEPGLVKPDIVLQPQSSGTKIALSWTKQGIYVDGKSIAGSPLVKYNVYKTLGDCTDGEFKQIGTATPELTAQDITASFIIPKLPNMQMDYCIYVTSSIEGKQYMEGFGKKIIV